MEAVKVLVCGFILLTFNDDVISNSKHCRRKLRLDKIRTQHRFDIEKIENMFEEIAAEKKTKSAEGKIKFSGTWYTYSRTEYIWEDDTWDSMSTKIYRESDGNWYFYYTGKAGDTCTPAEVMPIVQNSEVPSRFKVGKKASQGRGYDLIISFTDYEYALVYFCYRPFKKNSRFCTKSGFQAELWSRSVQPDTSIMAKYEHRAEKRLCDKIDLFETQPGECQLPQILSEAKVDPSDQDNSTAELPSGNRAGETSCLVEQIKFQEKFSLQQMSGIWYEIARTRLTFNQMESGVTYNSFDEKQNLINSYYTGTTNGECQTAIPGMSKKKSEDGPEADMLGRIGGPDSVYPWAPMKMLYADDIYLMFYACYGVNENGSCDGDKVEVTLVGRTRDIDELTLEDMKQILTSVCINPEHLLNTAFDDNCTDWVYSETGDPDFSSFVVDDIPTSSDFIIDNEELYGVWYAVAARDFGPEGALKGAVVNIKNGSLDSLIMQSTAIRTSDGNCTRLEDEYIRERCLYTMDFIRTVKAGHVRQWISMKTLYVDDSVWVTYLCKQENDDGTCNPAGVSIQVLSRTPDSLDNITIEAVNSRLHRACKLNYEDLHTISEFCEAEFEGFSEDGLTATGDGVEEGRSEKSPYKVVSPVAEHVEEHRAVNEACDVDGIMLADDYDIYNETLISGYWYGVADIYNSHSPINSFLQYIHVGGNRENGYLRIDFVATMGANNTCVGPVPVNSKPRCKDEINGDYLLRFGYPGTWTYSIAKILYTDYENVLVMYNCVEVMADGTCREEGQQLRIVSRNATLAKDTLNFLTELNIFEDACINSSRLRMTDVNDIDEDCFSLLRKHVEENYEEEYYGEDEMRINETSAKSHGETVAPFVL